ncbi:MAG TPA: hypothetical protein VHL78_10070 [Actinomycetota bacterium]|nr:hypothetical protein [Actinomycetota bacterium]
MRIEFTSPNAAINSDLAFWGNHAFVGYYRNDIPVGGVRVFDISNPADPVLIKDIQCDGLQNDPIVWDRDKNGVADLLLLAVDRTMASPECGAPRSAHDDPNGWEGFRVFTMSDNPSNPFARVRQRAAVYQDCGSHTITLWPGLARSERKLIIYSSSYPLRPGPTCGQANFDNTTNPYDEDPGSPGDPLHGVIQVAEVPLDAPSASNEIAQPRINYPGDPDNQIDWCERGLCAPGVLEPAARACHDIVVHVDERMAGGACAEQGQVWRIRPNGIPRTGDPITIVDDEVTSGGTGNIPGAVDFFHSAMFNNEGDVLNTVDESFGEGCPPFTTYQPRPWNPDGGTHKTGRMFFSDTFTGEFFSDFQVGDVRPEESEGFDYCSAHMGMSVMDVERDLLVNAWYMGGVDVIDYTRPRRLQEIAWYDIAPPGPEGSDNWSAYPYIGPEFGNQRDIPIYASDGVHNPPTARGMVVFRWRNSPEYPDRVRNHLNPQTMD